CVANRLLERSKSSLFFSYDGLVRDQLGGSPLTRRLGFEELRFDLGARGLGFCQLRLGLVHFYNRTTALPGIWRPHLPGSPGLARRPAGARPAAYICPWQDALSPAQLPGLTG